MKPSVIQAAEDALNKLEESMSDDAKFYYETPIRALIELCKPKEPRYRTRAAGFKMLTEITCDTCGSLLGYNDLDEHQISCPNCGQRLK